MLPDVPVHDKDVKGGEGVGGHVPRLVTVHPVHLGTVHGSVVNLEFAMECACGRAESVLPGDLWLIGRVPGIVRLLAGHLDRDLGFVPSTGMAGFRGDVSTVGGGTA